jgi:hypothetical protein
MISIVDITCLSLEYASLLLLLLVIAFAAIFIWVYAADESTYGGVLESDVSIISILVSFTSVIR